MHIYKMFLKDFFPSSSLFEGFIVDSNHVLKLFIYKYVI